MRNLKKFNAWSVGTPTTAGLHSRKKVNSSLLLLSEMAEFGCVCVRVRVCSDFQGFRSSTKRETRIQTDFWLNEFSFPTSVNVPRLDLQHAEEQERDTNTIFLTSFVGFQLEHSQNVGPMWDVPSRDYGVHFLPSPRYLAAVRYREKDPF